MDYEQTGVDNTQFAAEEGVENQQFAEAEQEQQPQQPQTEEPAAQATEEPSDVETHKAFANRLATRTNKAVEQYENENAAALAVGRAILQMNPGMTADQITQKEIEKFAEANNVTPAIAQMLVAQQQQQQSLEAQQPSQDDWALSQFEIFDRAMPITINKALEDPEFLALAQEQYSKGEVPLTQLWYDLQLSRAMQQGAQGKVEEITKRNNTIPDTTTTAPPGGQSVIDYANMSKEDFAKAKKSVLAGGQIPL